MAIEALRATARAERTEADRQGLYKLLCHSREVVELVTSARDRLRAALEPMTKRIITSSGYIHDGDHAGCEHCNRIRIAREALNNEPRKEEANPTQDVAKPHNPDNLTPEQIGVADGWRLLDEDEVLQKYGAEVEAWDEQGIGWMWYKTNWASLPFRGSAYDRTYRTKLTRSELRKARGLEPEAYEYSIYDAVGPIEAAAPGSTPPACPKCGSRDISEGRTLPARKCYHCNHVWPVEPVSGTPETDAAIKPYCSELRPYVTADFARTLERQRNDAREQLAAVTRERDIKERAICAYESESAQLREQVARLTEEREKFTTPSFCGVSGHFRFQQNGNSCLMCQRESRLISEATASLRTQLTQTQAECAAMHRTASSLVKYLCTAGERDEKVQFSAAMPVSVLEDLCDALDSASGTNLLARLKAAEEDVRRLEWLSDDFCDKIVLVGSTWAWTPGNVRAAIDAAMGDNV